MSEKEGALDEYAIPPRSFDPSVYCLPFALPSHTLAPPHAADGLFPLNSLAACTPASIDWRVLNLAETVVGEGGGGGEDVMGIAGGVGSGSSLGSRARTLPASKFTDGYVAHTAESNVAGGGGGGGVLRGISMEATRDAGKKVVDASLVHRDVSVLAHTEALVGTTVVVAGGDDALSTLPMLSRLPGMAEGMTSPWDGWARRVGDGDGGRSSAPAAGVDAGMVDDTAGLKGDRAALQGGPGAVPDGGEAWWLSCPYSQLSMGAPATTAALPTSRVGDHDECGGGGTPASGPTARAPLVLSPPHLPGMIASPMDTMPSPIAMAAGMATAGPLTGKAGEPPGRRGGGSGNRVGRVTVMGRGGEAGAWAADESDSEDDVEATTRRDLALARAMVGLGGSRPMGAAAVESVTPPPTSHSTATAPIATPTLLRLGAGSGGEDGDGDGMGDALPLPSTRAAMVAPTTPGSWVIPQRMSEEEIAAAEATFRPAMTWPFRLDTFQREAIVHMETQGSSTAVFVAAHTSAGKTLVAEYAIALSLSHRARAVYTSPIKALSNQKFHDLRARFGGPDGKGVGIITGDVSLNPDAPCLIMTTEILRSMLYRGDDMIRDIEFCIFDEIHYITDEDRGLAYEEVLMLLPDSVGLVFLSATSPNKEEFAEWVGRIKRKPVRVVGTSKRPVPLLHHLWADNGMHVLMDGAAMDVGDTATGWKSYTYKIVAERVAARAEKREGTGGGRGPLASTSAGRSGGGVSKQDKQQWSNLLKTLETKDLLPCIVFAFSKKKCEEVAFLGLGSADLTTAREKSAIHMFVDTAVKRLSSVDRDLPQIVRLRGLLRRGIGVHHSGLLPIMKECVELLFARGLVKVLFATETFAMGINMPARCVVFNGIRKHDGTTFRTLTSGEYVQMAGRAGRRGLDTRGIVIVMCWGDALPEQGALQAMMSGKPTSLASQFRLTYNMMLNVLRTDLPVTGMMARSFSEFATQRALAGKDVAKLLADAAAQAQEVLDSVHRSWCVRHDSGEYDTPLLVDVEEAAGLPPSRRFANRPAIATFYERAQVVRQGHLAQVATLMAQGRSSAQSLYCPGRVVVAEALTVEVGDGASAGASVTLFNVPCVVLDATPRTKPTPASTASPAQPSPSVASLLLGSPSTSMVADAAGGSAATSYHLRVVALLPPCHLYPSPPTPLVDDAAGGGSPGPSATPLPGGLVKLVKKGVDEDMEYLRGAGKKKGGGRTPTPMASSPVSPAAPPDRAVHVGYRHAFRLSPPATAAMDAPDPAALPHRLVMVTGLHSTSLARVTSMVVPGVATVLAGKGSVNGLEGVARRLWEMLCKYRADATMAVDAPPPPHHLRVGREGFTLAPWRLPLLNPATDIKLADTSLEQSARYHDVVDEEGRMWASKCTGCVHFDAQWHQQRALDTLQTRIRKLKAKYSVESLALFPEMQIRFRLLRRLHYIKPAEAGNQETAVATAPRVGMGGLLHSDAADAAGLGDVVALKGRVAAEVNTADELLFTEMIFGGVLNPLSPAECAALLSCLVFKERSGNRDDAAPFPPVDADPTVEEVGVGDDVEGEDAASRYEAATRARAAALEAVRSMMVADAATTPRMAPGTTAGVSGGEEADEEAPADESGDAGSPATGDVTTGSAAAGDDAGAAGGDGVTGDEAGGIPPEVAHFDPSVYLGGAGPTHSLIQSVPATLALGYTKLHDIAIALGRLQAAEGLDVVPSQYARKCLNYDLLLPTYAWACGVPFAAICTLTPVAEGMIVRTISRLDETCREVRNAARIIGDAVLFRKMEVASSAINRDVIFASSLYLQ